MSTTTSPSYVGLRMRNSRSSVVAVLANTDDIVDRLQAMLEQERRTYKCRDYLARRRCHADWVDEACREKMCEWSFRVCDHFGQSREIVAISLDYLDRFIDRCNCDRTAFKLAAMTTLYMATKLFHGRQLSIQGLADLSRGEFTTDHIVEMERILLNTLEWKLNPPTVHCFIAYLHGLVPGVCSPGILQRAMFFAELALYDYWFVTKDASRIAVASILNAMEGMHAPKHQKEGFLRAVYKLMGVADLDALCQRLWHLYTWSAQYQEHDVVAPEALDHVTKRHYLSASPDSGLPRSPTCVANHTH